MVRKTNEYYIEQLKNDPSNEIIEEVIKKYGFYNEIKLEHQEFGECKLTAICYISAFGIYLSIEFLDGETTCRTCISFDTVKGVHEKGTPLYVKIKDNTYYQITPDVHTGIIKGLIDYLSPESIKNRKVKELINKSLTPIFRMFDTQYYPGETRAQIMVYISDYIKEHVDELLRLKSHEFESVVADTALDKFKQIIIDEYIAKNEQ